MWFSLLPFFILFLFRNNGCLCKITPIKSYFGNSSISFCVDDQHISRSNGNQNNNSNQNVRSITRLLDLNGDVLHLIFKHLELVELMNIAEVDAILGGFARNEFRRKYQEYRIDILGHDIYARTRGALTVDHRRKVIELGDYDVKLNILENFLTGIKKLRIDNRFIEGNELITMNKLVNKFGAEFLTHLNLGNTNNDALKQYQKPFKCVEDLFCIIDISGTARNMLPFNILFPRLRRLSLTLYSGDDFSFIDCTFSELEYLDITVSETSWKQRAQIERMIQKNGHIKSIEIKNFPDNYIKTIAELLPNLENLTIFDNCNLDETVRLENVKHFKLYSKSANSINRLSFPQLESIKFVYSSEYFNEWVSFFCNHCNLTKLTINNHFGMENLRLLELTSKLQNLVELTVESYYAISDQIISRIIQQHDELMKLQFSVLHYDDVEAIREQFQNEWNITKILRPDAILMERKNSTVFE